MKTYDEKHIGNIVLLGAAKSGKTTLCETMLSTKIAGMMALKEVFHQVVRGELQQKLMEAYKSVELV